MDQAKHSILAKNKTAIAVAVSVAFIAAGAYATLSGQSISDLAKKGVASTVDKEAALVIGEIGYVNDALIAEKKANKETVTSLAIGSYGQVTSSYWHHTGPDDDRVSVYAAFDTSKTAYLDAWGHVPNNAKYIVVNADIVGKDGCADVSVNVTPISGDTKSYEICLAQGEQIVMPVKPVTKAEFTDLNKKNGSFRSWNFIWTEPARAN